MVVLRLCRKLGVSQCPRWHNKAKPKSVARRTDHNSDKALVAYTAEVDMKSKPWEVAGLENDA